MYNFLVIYERANDNGGRLTLKCAETELFNIAFFTLNEDNVDGQLSAATNL